MMTAHTDSQLAKRVDLKLFSGEKLLVIVGLIGFALAAGIAVYISLYGSMVLPEGNAMSAFSFNAAMGMFILSIAAILPVSGLRSGKRASIRWFFILAALYSYGIETVQHLRGIDPRFSQVGTTVDLIAGGLFGMIALLIVIATALLAIPFFRKRQPDERPLLVLGIRYAFVSAMIAHAAGIWMIALESRFTGEAGNLIVLHGLGFHALQTLVLLGWLLERAHTDEKRARLWIHTGGMAWTFSILLIGWQTALGRSVFEAGWLFFSASVLLLIWLVAFVVAVVDLLKTRKVSPILSPRQANTVSGEESRDLV